MSPTPRPSFPPSTASEANCGSLDGGEGVEELEAEQVAVEAERALHVGDHDDREGVAEAAGHHARSASACACSASSATAPRGTTTTGTGDAATIFEAREPRKTRATRPHGAGADHQHLAVLPLDVLERLLPALPVADDGLERRRDRREVADLIQRGPAGRPDLLGPLAIIALSASLPTPDVYGGRERTANEASRNEAPTVPATPAAATTSSSAPSEPP